MAPGWLGLCVQVSESELEAIARMGGDAGGGMVDLAALEAGGVAATRGLLGQYNQAVALPQVSSAARRSSACMHICMDMNPGSAQTG